jgi:uncharacterized protein YbjT (DUF2867 family)
MKTGWIAGASGLVGSQLLALLLADTGFGTVVSLGRKRLELASSKLVQRAVDFGSLDVEGLAAPDVVFCALGTTIGKAGSQARAAGAHCFVLVSSLGADPRSRISYNRVKGETEADLGALGFASLAIAQPSLLLGDRAESRPTERALVVASRFLSGVLKPFASRPIEAHVLARALLAIAHDPPTGTRRYPSGELQSLGAG